MGCKLFCVSGVVFFVFYGANALYGETITVDDFNDGIDDSWLRANTAAGTFDASSGSYELTSNGPYEGELFDVSATLFAEWLPSADGRFQDGFFRARMNAHTASTSSALVMRWDGTNGYAFYLGESPLVPNVSILRISSSGVEEQLDGQVDIDFVAGEDWFIEAGAVGDQLSMKVWRVGESEPMEPQLLAHDATAPTGRFAVWSAPLGVGTPYGTKYDDITFTVPEPTNSLAMLIGLGTTTFFWRRRSVGIASALCGSKNRHGPNQDFFCFCRTPSRDDSYEGFDQ